MKCHHCHTNLDGKPCWGSHNENGEAIYLCEDCFKESFGEDEQEEVDLASTLEDGVVCRLCHRLLADDELFMEDDKTGDCYCMPCFEEHQDELMAKYQ